MYINLIMTYQGSLKKNTMTQIYKYDTPSENMFKIDDLGIFFNCGPARCIKKLSSTFILKWVTKSVEKPNNPLSRGPEESSESVTLIFLCEDVSYL